MERETLLTSRDKRIAELEKRLERYEKLCRACGGGGWGGTYPNDDEHNQPVCSRCHGKGKVPRVILPDNFVKVLVNAKSVEDIEDYLLKNATHLPYGWELQEVQE